MRERKDTVGRITGVAEGLAAAVRRRQYDRTPRVMLYDRAGHPRIVPVADFRHEQIVAAAARLIALAPGGPPEQVERVEAAASGAAEADGAAMPDIAGPADPETAGEAGVGDAPGDEGDAPGFAVDAAGPALDDGDPPGRGEP